jgi:arylsulfatase A-like enzyme
VRIVYFDVDSLRADHLGCYGYHRDTTPTIDALAAEGLRFDGVYASDTPCLPSRTALITGRFGIHNGVVGQGGTAADLPVAGPERGRESLLAATSWVRLLRAAGLHTTTISTFADRHSAAHWTLGFHEAYNLGSQGWETADEVATLAVDWIRRNGARDNWFLHVHMWDPHTPYRTPAEFGNPFAGTEPPAWLDEAVRAEHWRRAGPHSAQEVSGFTPDGWGGSFPRQPASAQSMAEVRAVFDGYDVGVHYADAHIGRILDELAGVGVLDGAAIMVSSDHGETLGELGIYCDHQTADEHVSRVPLVLRWPGVTQSGSVHHALHYQIDVAATIAELAGASIPHSWDGRSFAGPLTAGVDTGRSHLVLTHGAWTAQRSVRFDDHLCIRTYHDGYHEFPDVMLFNVRSDPHEQTDLAREIEPVVHRAMDLLDAWKGEAMSTSATGIDPLDTVLRDGGPWYVRGKLPAYLDRLRATGRSDAAARLAARL